MKPKDVTLYLDMDNTMVLFSTRDDEEEQLKKMHNKGFYLGLSPAFGLRNVLNVLRKVGFNVKVLSGLIDSPYVEEEKIEWCLNYGFNREDIILIPMAERKCDYVEAIDGNTILVDDYKRYLDEWESIGGKTILVNRKYIGAISETEVRNFYDILEVLAYWRGLGLTASERDELKEEWLYLLYGHE
jgi:hypothetical protein